MALARSKSDWGLVEVSFCAAMLALALPSSSIAIAQVSTVPMTQSAGGHMLVTGSDLSTGSGVASRLETATISGTATDADHEVVPGARVKLEGPSAGDERTAMANDLGAFAFSDLIPGGPYYVTIRAEGFTSWRSEAINLTAGQFFFVSDEGMRIAGGETSITVFGSSEQIAAEQVALAEQQRVLGVIPNFYVVYDHNPAPLTNRLKFSLAMKTEIDPVVFLGAAFVAGMDQAGNTPDYGQGLKGYAQRLGANYTTGFTDIMLGGAILPSLLHQDPRYFYQGTGTTKSRVLHALSSPFICKGDNGRSQPNFSSVGGDLAASAISNLYYPESSRGMGLVFDNFLLTTSGRMVNSVIQEFLLRRLTPGARHRE